MRLTTLATALNTYDNLNISHFERTEFSIFKNISFSNLGMHEARLYSAETYSGPTQTKALSAWSLKNDAISIEKYLLYKYNNTFYDYEFKHFSGTYQKEWEVRNYVAPIVKAYDGRSEWLYIVPRNITRKEGVDTLGYLRSILKTISSLMRVRDDKTTDVPYVNEILKKVKFLSDFDRNKFIKLLDTEGVIINPNSIWEVTDSIDLSESYNICCECAELFKNYVEMSKRLSPKCSLGILKQFAAFMEILHNSISILVKVGITDDNCWHIPSVPLLPYSVLFGIPTDVILNMPKDFFSISDSFTKQLDKVILKKYMDDKLELGMF